MSVHCQSSLVSYWQEQPRSCPHSALRSVRLSYSLRNVFEANWKCWSALSHVVYSPQLELGSFHVDVDVDASAAGATGWRSACRAKRVPVLDNVNVTITSERTDELSRHNRSIVAQSSRRHVNAIWRHSPCSQPLSACWVGDWGWTRQLRGPSERCDRSPAPTHRQKTEIIDRRRAANSAFHGEMQ